MPSKISRSFTDNLTAYFANWMLLACIQYLSRLSTTLHTVPSPDLFLNRSLVNMLCQKLSACREKYYKSSRNLPWFRWKSAIILQKLLYHLLSLSILSSGVDKKPLSKSDFRVLVLTRYRLHLMVVVMVLMLCCCQQVCCCNLYTDGDGNAGREQADVPLNPQWKGRLTELTTVGYSLPMSQLLDFQLSDYV